MSMTCSATRSASRSNSSSGAPTVSLGWMRGVWRASRTCTRAALVPSAAPSGTPVPLHDARVEIAFLAGRLHLEHLSYRADDPHYVTGLQRSRTQRAVEPAGPDSTRNRVHRVDHIAEYSSVDDRPLSNHR